jgi:hypothetical protein
MCTFRRAGTRVGVPKARCYWQVAVQAGNDRATVNSWTAPSWCTGTVASARSDCTIAVVLEEDDALFATKRQS